VVNLRGSNDTREWPFTRFFLDKNVEIIQNADRDMDHDKLRDAISEVVSDLPFLEEWSVHRETRIHLDQSDGQIVDYLVNCCGETPEWLRPALNHVPPEKWREHGVRP
jgi:hypothetical protein